MRRFLDRHLIALTLLPVLALMVMIFGFSAQNGEESGALSARVTAAMIALFCPGYAQLGAAERAALFARAAHLVRKAAHFSEFAALGFFLSGHFSAIACKKALRRPALGAGLVGVLYAASDEIHQSFVGGRGPAVTDVLIDSAGVLFGLLVMALLLRACRAKKG